MKTLSPECEFENLRDSLIKDMIVCGTNHDAFREKLLRESGFTLSRGISAGHAAEETRKHAREILQLQSSADLHKINKLHKPRHQVPNEKSKEIIKKCKFCNGSHPRGKCPAYGKSCLNCNRKNHFKVCCPRNRKKVHEIGQIETDCEESSDLEFFVETISIQDPLNINEIKNESSVWSIILTSNGLPISYNIDIGAQCNVVPLKIYQKLNPQPDLHPVNLKLSAYNNSKISVTGKCSLTLEHKSELFNVSFLVVDIKSVSILGLKLCENLKLIKCSVESKENPFLSEFSDCFGEIGTLNKTHHIEIKENFPPVVTPVQRISHFLKPKVEKELKRIVDLDIIEPVDEPTDWVNDQLY